MLGHKHLLPSINISLAEILKSAEEYIVYFFIKVAVISGCVLLTACDPRQILLNSDRIISSRFAA